MLSRACIAVVSGLILLIPGLAGAQDPRVGGLSAQDLKRLSIEELAAIDVTSVSRRAERLSDTAAAVSVIRGEDIRRSGYTTLADAMRLADGLDVARVNSTTWGVSARGFNTNPANKLLVLIDGRTVYSPLTSGTFWDAQDVVLPDVDRIEVIRGPGGAIWGANAVNGVINVITKDAASNSGFACHPDVRHDRTRDCRGQTRRPRGGNRQLPRLRQVPAAWLRGLYHGRRRQRPAADGARGLSSRIRKPVCRPLVRAGGSVSRHAGLCRPA